MTKLEQNQYYTADELSTLLRIKRKTLYTQISKKKFPIHYFKTGNHLLFLIIDVENYLKSCRIEVNTLPIKNKADIKDTNHTKMINQRKRVR